MIHLITGLPGNGKTLFLLHHLNERAKRENRQVYYNGINLTDKGKDITGWEEFADPTAWWDFPPQAIVVIDEAQRPFRPMPSGARVPKHIEMLETHRHGGIDLYLITQRPRLIHAHVRDLVNDHQHVKRMFGLPRSVVSRWDECKETVNKSAYKEAQQSTFVFPKDVYTWYKSAEAHTHKLSIPWKKLGIMAAALCVLVLCLSFLYFSFAPYFGKDKGKAERPDPDTPIPAGQAFSPVAAAQAQPDYFGDRVPRLTGLPHTAKVYDGITAPTQAPKPAACIVGSGKQAVCSCYTQQGTRMVGMPQDLCRDIVRNGWFDDSAPINGPIQANGPVSDQPTSKG